MIFMHSSQEPSSVVPAERIEYLIPVVFRKRCTSATCSDTEAVGVPIGTKQKSAVHLGGVEIDDMVSVWVQSGGCNDIRDEGCNETNEELLPEIGRC